MTRRDRLRRTILLGCSFGRNLAFYRAGCEPAFAALFDPRHLHVSFWRQANSSFLEIAVLEWHKLIGDRKGSHAWHNVVADNEAFKAALLTRLSMDSDSFAHYVRQMKDYRDKFVAHLDSDLTMQIPFLTTAKDSVWFYCEHVMSNETEDGDLYGLPDTIGQMESGYLKSLDEAREIFSRDLDWISD